MVKSSENYFCPECDSWNINVTDSRPAKENPYDPIMVMLGSCRGPRRRRRCTDCGHKWTTYEVYDVDMSRFLQEHAEARKNAKRDILLALVRSFDRRDILAAMSEVITKEAAE